MVAQDHAKRDYVGQNRDRRNMNTRRADLAVWLALRYGVSIFRAQ
jgi:hypothetical protein